MKAKTKNWVLAFILAMFTLVSIDSNSLVANAQSLDDLQQAQETAITPTQETIVEPQYSDDNALTDYLRGYTPVTQENMRIASDTVSPIVNFLGTVTGAIMMLASAGIFFTTALDMLAIGVPTIRPLLYTEPAQGGGMPMAGIGMGMQGGESKAKSRKFISEDAIKAINMANSGGQASAGIPNTGIPGMSAPSQPQGGGTKPALLTYLINRAFFLVLFAICSVVLLSSLFTDCGINIAELISKIVEKASGEISNIQV